MQILKPKSNKLRQKVKMLTSHQVASKHQLLENKTQNANLKLVFCFKNCCGSTVFIEVVPRIYYNFVEKNLLFETNIFVFFEKKCHDKSTNINLIFSISVKFSITTMKPKYV
jgi:hypothetical protein